MPHGVLTMPYSLSRNSSMWSSMLWYWDVLSAITILLLILKHQNCKSFKVNNRFKVIFPLLSDDRGSRLFLFTQVNMYWGCSSNNELWNRLLLLVLIVHDIPIGGKKEKVKSTSYYAKCHRHVLVDSFVILMSSLVADICLM